MGRERFFDGVDRIFRYVQIFSEMLSRFDAFGWDGVMFLIPMRGCMAYKSRAPWAPAGARCLASWSPGLVRSGGLGLSWARWIECLDPDFRLVSSRSEPFRAIFTSFRAFQEEAKREYCSLVDSLVPGWREHELL